MVKTEMKLTGESLGEYLYPYSSKFSGSGKLLYALTKINV